MTETAHNDYQKLREELRELKQEVEKLHLAVHPRPQSSILQLLQSKGAVVPKHIFQLDSRERSQTTSQDLAEEVK